MTAVPLRDLIAAGAMIQPIGSVASSIQLPAGPESSWSRFLYSPLVKRGLAAREAVASILAHSNFDVFVMVDDRTKDFIPAGERVHVQRLDTIPYSDRADSFLAKFAALEWCLAESDAAIVLQFDADAMLLRSVTDEEIEAALGACQLGMVEQTAIRGSTMRRRDFLEHYTRCSLHFIAPDLPVPAEADFRYFGAARGASGIPAVGARHAAKPDRAACSRRPHDCRSGLLSGLG
jgi:hypothetical protein